MKYFFYKKFFLVVVLLAVGLVFTGCWKKVPASIDQGDSSSAPVVVENPPVKPVITEASYEKSINEIFQSFWQNRQVAGLKDKVLEQTVPPKYLDFHFDLVVALELVEQGQKDSDQAKIEQGFEQIDGLSNKNVWFK